MEAEAAFVVAFAGKVIIDRDRSFGLKLMKEVGSTTYDERSDTGDD